MQPVIAPNSERKMEKQKPGKGTKESGEERGPRRTKDNLNRDHIQTKKKVGKVPTKNLFQNLVLNVHPPNIAQRNVVVIHSSTIGLVDIVKPKI